MAKPRAQRNRRPDTRVRGRAPLLRRDNSDGARGRKVRPCRGEEDKCAEKAKTERRAGPVGRADSSRVLADLRVRHAGLFWRSERVSAGSVKRGGLQLQ